MSNENDKQMQIDTQDHNDQDRIDDEEMKAEDEIIKNLAVDLLIMVKSA